MKFFLPKAREEAHQTQVREHDTDGEIILAIFESLSYVVCTPSRGAFRGDPILVGRDQASDILLFEP
jgi:hypothetical protein